MITRLKRCTKSFTLILAAIFLAAMNSGVPVLAAPDTTDNHKGDLYYYTQNGIIFYEGGILRCDSGGIVAGGAADILKAQKNLDPKWIPVILNEAADAGADPLAMASLLFWEHRGFPAYGAGPHPSESDSIGRGPWQITSGTWKTDKYGPYMVGAYDPVISTKAAAELVKNWGGEAGIPIGSIDQDFSKNVSTPSMATVAKNYNAGQATWREPGVATYKQAGRQWLAPKKNWNNVPVGNITKADVIDDYILGMTYAYYLMATNTAQLSAGGGTNTATFVNAALANTDKIKGFSFGDSADAGNKANTCGPTIDNGNIVQTAKGLAWPNRNYDGTQYDRKTAARDTYQRIMPEVQGEATARSVYKGKTAWTDCGVFVATTMRYSGADPDYQKRGTGLQLPYLRANGNPNDPNRKYDVFENFNNVGQVQPGDVFIVHGGDVGHTFIFTGKYTGDDGKEYDSMSASWGKRTPMAADAYFKQDGYQYVIARLRVNPLNTSAESGARFE